MPRSGLGGGLRSRAPPPARIFWQACAPLAGWIPRPVQLAVRHRPPPAPPRLWTTSCRRVLASRSALCLPRSGSRKATLAARRSAWASLYSRGGGGGRGARSARATGRIHKEAAQRGAGRRLQSHEAQPHFLAAAGFCGGGSFFHIAARRGSSCNILSNSWNFSMACISCRARRCSRIWVRNIAKLR